MIADKAASASTAGSTTALIDNNAAVPSLVPGLDPTPPPSVPALDNIAELQAKLDAKHGPAATSVRPSTQRKHIANIFALPKSSGVASVDPAKAQELLCPPDVEPLGVVVTSHADRVNARLGVALGCCDSLGGRNTQEDRMLVTASVLGDDKFVLAAVFDGHGGDGVAEYLRVHFAQRLHTALLEERGYAKQQARRGHRGDEVALPQQRPAERDVSAEPPSSSLRQSSTGSSVGSPDRSSDGSPLLKRVQHGVSPDRPLLPPAASEPIAFPLPDASPLSAAEHAHGVDALHGDALKQRGSPLKARQLAHIAGDFATDSVAMALHKQPHAKPQSSTLHAASHAVDAAAQEEPAATAPLRISATQGLPRTQTSSSAGEPGTPATAAPDGKGRAAKYETNYFAGEPDFRRLLTFVVKQLDRELLDAKHSHLHDAGSCAAFALLYGDALIVANVGDCEAWLCRGGRPYELTCPHKADRKAEEQRIRETGGQVTIWRGQPRVGGALLVSRSIGMYILKHDYTGVIPDPFVRVVQLRVPSLSSEATPLASPAFHGLLRTPTGSFLVDDGHAGSAGGLVRSSTLSQQCRTEAAAIDAEVLPMPASLLERYANNSEGDMPSVGRQTDTTRGRNDGAAPARGPSRLSSMFGIDANAAATAVVAPAQGSRPPLAPPHTRSSSRMSSSLGAGAKPPTAVSGAGLGIGGGVATLSTAMSTATPMPDGSAPGADTPMSVIHEHVGGSTPAARPSITREASDQWPSHNSITGADMTPAATPIDDEFVVLGSDGLFDMFPNRQDLMNRIKRALRQTGNADEACTSVVSQAVARGAQDNVSMAIIVFNQGGVVTSTARALGGGVGYARRACARKIHSHATRQMQKSDDVQRLARCFSDTRGTTSRMAAAAAEARGSRQSIVGLSGPLVDIAEQLRNEEHAAGRDASQGSVGGKHPLITQLLRPASIMMPSGILASLSGGTTPASPPLEQGTNLPARGSFGSGARLPSWTTDAVPASSPPRRRTDADDEGDEIDESGPTLVSDVTADAAMLV